MGKLIRKNIRITQRQAARLGRESKLRGLECVEKVRGVYYAPAGGSEWDAVRVETQGWLPR